MTQQWTQLKTGADHSKLVQVIGSLTGQSVQAVAIIASVGNNERTSVTAYLSAQVASPRFRHAIDMERAYTESLIAFDDMAPPFYDGSFSVDLKRVAQEVGVDRVLCFISMSTDDSVSGTRDYDGAEVTVIETAMKQLSALHTHLDRLASPSSTGKMQ